MTAATPDHRNVLGGPLLPCNTDPAGGSEPVTGFYRDGSCTVGPEDVGVHGVCTVVTAEFLEHQRSVGNDLSTPRPEYGFVGLSPGDRWCVVALRWRQAEQAGLRVPVVLASTHESVLAVIPLAVLRAHAVDVPDTAEGL